MSENIQLPPTFNVAFPIAPDQQPVLHETMRDAAQEMNDYLYQEHSEHYDVRARQVMSLVLLGAGAVTPRRQALADAGFNLNTLQKAANKIDREYSGRPVSVPIRRAAWWPRGRGAEQGNLFGVELSLDSEAAQHLSQQRTRMIGALQGMGVEFLPVQFPDNILLVDVPSKANLEPEDRQAIERIAMRRLNEAGIDELRFAPVALRILNQGTRRNRERRSRTS
jgi:hypothetical protein